MTTFMGHPVIINLCECDQLPHINLKVWSTKDGTYVLTIGIAHLTMVGFAKFHPEI